MTANPQYANLPGYDSNGYPLVAFGSVTPNPQYANQPGYDADGLPLVSLSASIYLTSKMYGAKGDGVKDDTADLQSVLDNAPVNSTIMVTDGVYIISRVNPGVVDYCLNIPKGVKLHLMAGAEIRLADGEITNGTDEVYMFNIASSDVIISGYGSINMNRAGQTNTTIGTNIGTRVCIDSNGGTYDNIKIETVLVKDAMGDGIRLKGANNISGQLTNVEVFRVKMENCREGVLFHWCNKIKCNFNTLEMDNSTGAQDGIETSECDDYEIIGNYVEGAQGSGYDLFFAGSRCVCSLNTAKNCGSGIAIGNNTVSGGAGTDFVVSNNIIDGVVLTFGIGVYLNLGADRVLFDGNIIRDVQVQHAVDISAGSGITFTNTQINGVTVGNGFFIRAGVNGTIIDGGRIEGTTGGSGVGVRCDADDCDITSLKITNTGSFGMILNGNNNYVSGNRLPGEIIDDNGVANIKTGNRVAVSGLNNTNATNPEDRGNWIGGVWAA